MTSNGPVAAVTGARGYLGSRICDSLEAEGWHVMRLSRSWSCGPGSRGPWSRGPWSRGQGQMISYDLAAPVTAQVREALRSANALIHAAYDLALTSAPDIWRVNVAGTRRLLEAANEEGVHRIIALSSMSAFAGTSQLYGRAKLDIEAMTVASGGCAVRPGLVHGDRAGGLAGTLRRLTALPVVPVLAGGAGVYTVREDDLMRVISLLASAAALEPGVISVAHPSRVTLPELLTTFAAQEHRQCRLVPLPWQLVYLLLRGGEHVRLRLPFRADSLLGLIHSAPGLAGGEQLARLGVTLRAFTAREPEVVPGGR